MTDNIIRLAPHERMTVEQALDYAHNENLQDILIIGYHQDGDLAIYSSSMSRETALFLSVKAQEYAMGWEQ